MLLRLCLAQAFFAYLCQGQVLPQLASEELGNSMNFITEPNFRVPRYNITIYEPDLVASGYWFVAPYEGSRTVQDTRAAFWQPCQAGPMIFDSHGDLIWSGACLNDNADTPDFRLFTVDGKPYLSFLVTTGSQPAVTGEGHIFDDGYQPVRTVDPTAGVPYVNMHEFKVINNGKSALMMATRVLLAEEANGVPTGFGGEIFDQVIREMDIATTEILFEWNAMDHLRVDDSSVPPALNDSNPYDYLHLNSLDKDANGDYLVSGRHTDTIYKVSGDDGHVIWRFGGKDSDFVLESFNFSRQHDAKFLESNKTHTVLSFLNNASDNFGSSTASLSSAYVVLLHTAVFPMRAELLRHYDQPDGGLTQGRGNIQHLHGGNVFVSWSLDDYHSEFTRDGKLVMEARFQGHQFVTYRAYKFDFTGNPSYPPVIKARAYWVSPDKMATACHVSWNGATEVAAWRFYTRAHEFAEDVFAGATKKDGFETVYVLDGYGSYVVAEALDSQGSSLGRSEIYQTMHPDYPQPDIETSSDLPFNRGKSTTLYAPLACVFLAWMLFALRSRLRAGYKACQALEQELHDEKNGRW